MKLKVLKQERKNIKSVPAELQLLLKQKHMMDCNMCYPNKECRLHHLLKLWRACSFLSRPSHYLLPSENHQYRAGIEMLREITASPSLPRTKIIIINQKNCHNFLNNNDRDNTVSRKLNSLEFLPIEHKIEVLNINKNNRMQMITFPTEDTH